MRICITAQGNDLDARVDPRFGRCGFFLLIEPGTGTVEAVENTNRSGMGGVGIQAGTLMADKGVDVVLTGNVGPNAFRTLREAGIKVVTGVDGKISDVVRKFQTGEYPENDGPNVGSHFGQKQ